MADDAVPIPLDLKIREYAFQLQDPSLSKLHEQAAKALWESVEKNGELLPHTTRPLGRNRAHSMLLLP